MSKSFLAGFGGTCGVVMALTVITIGIPVLFCGGCIFVGGLGLAGASKVLKEYEEQQKAELDAFVFKIKPDLEKHGIVSVDSTTLLVDGNGVKHLLGGGEDSAGKEKALNAEYKLPAGNDKPQIVWLEIDGKVVEGTKPAEAAVAPREIDKLTLANFYKVEMGMTYDEVKAIIGEGTEISADSEIAGIKITMISWHGFLGANCNVMFQNGKAVSKAQFGLR